MRLSGLRTATSRGLVGLAARGGCVSAATLTYTVDYVKTGGSCDGPACDITSLLPFTATFVLDSSALAIDGTYNVTSSYTGNPYTPTIALPIFGGTANAIVTEGEVADLAVFYHYQPSLFFFDFEAQSGTFTYIESFGT